MTSALKALTGTTSEKRTAPSRTGEEIILEMLWTPQLPLIIGLGGDPSRTLDWNSRKRSESVSGIFPEFFWNFFRKVPGPNTSRSL